jgi:hypothetical protein
MGATSAVTYTLSYGRFGDHLVSYCHAKWISHKYQIPLLYKQFKYSDKLALHLLEKPYAENEVKKFKKIVLINTKNLCTIDPQANTLYVIPYFPETNFDMYNHNNDFDCQFAINWSDEEFQQELIKMIAPIDAIHLPDLPKNCVNIAVHVRKGTGYDDTAILNKTMPMKFPPDSFYISQMNYCIKLFSNKKICFHIFTDHDKPEDLATLYNKAITNKNQENITFCCRQKENSHTKNVLEDFFMLTMFDFIIRPDSNFSIIAARLGNPSLEICPSSFIQKNNEILIDKSYIYKKG